MNPVLYLVMGSCRVLVTARKLILSSVLSSHLRMVLFTRVNGSKTYVMVLECRFGQMEQNTKVDGSLTKLRVVESSGTQMVTSLMESGKRIKLMDLGPTRTLMERSTRESG